MGKASEINGTRIVVKRIGSVEEVNNNRTLIEAFFAESRFAKYELSWGRVENLAKAAISAPDKMIILIAEKVSKTDRQILGFAMGGISGYIGVVGLKLCNIQFLHILPEFRKTYIGGKAMIGLLRGIEQWAKAQGAKEISFDIEVKHTSTAFNKITSKLGYKTETIGFMKWI